MSVPKSSSSVGVVVFNAGTISLLVLYLFILMEWLFFATKVSFLSSYPVFERTLSLWGAPLLWAPAVLGLTLVCILLYYLFFRCFNIRLLALLAAVPATGLTVLTMLLVDNFANTVINTGIRDTERVSSIILLCMLGGIWLIWCLWVAGKIDNPQRLLPKLTAGLIGISALALATMFIWSEDLETIAVSRTSNSKLPNIIFFAADGIQASHMSTYGYHRKTTPKIDELSSNALVVFNTVANSGRTTGSTTSLLTGKYPTTTKVIFPPHVLRNRHTFQHLPGLLKNLGYQNIQESVRYYADAADLNMHGAFDYANGRAITEAKSIVSKNIRYKLFPSFSLVERIRDRVTSKSLHLLGVRKIEKVSDAVDPEKAAKVYGTRDSTRIKNVLGFIRDQEKPVFAHVHLMDTHCCNHRPDKKVFSKGQKRINFKNAVDFYDDIILETDSLFGQFIEQLKAMGEFDNTLIVYSSDHTRGWHANRSVPLVMKFPAGEHAGKRYGSHQLIDVAPTIVNYLGLSTPEWMEGRSILKTDPDSAGVSYTVDSVETDKTLKKGELAKLAGSGPPLFGVKVISLITCGNNFFLNIQNGDFVRHDFLIQGKGCAEVVDDGEAKSKLEKHLVDRGFAIPYLD